MNAAAPEPANTSAADTTAPWLGGIALALAVIGLAIALAVALRSRRAGRPAVMRRFAVALALVIAALVAGPGSPARTTC
jgi:hypothetical protein